MLSIRDIFRLKSAYRPPLRSLDYHFIRDPERQRTMLNQGYVHFTGVVPAEALEIARNVFNRIEQSKDFYTCEGFITSCNYGNEVQRFVHDQLGNAAELIIPDILHREQIVYDLLNALMIKFSSPGSSLVAHQHMPMVDERKAPTCFIWAPLSDIHERNGALLVLPGSHQWAAWLRTHNLESTPVSRHQETLLSHMRPLFPRSGDLILFDSALIHASAPNTAEVPRLAMNFSVVPKGNELLHYSEMNCKPGEIRRYSVDRNFYRDISYINPDDVDEKYNPFVMESINPSYPLSHRELVKLISSSSDPS